MKHSQVYEAVFGDKYIHEQYKYEPHSFKDGNRIAGKAYCSRCGLIATGNRFTQWSVDKGCVSHLHPQYQSQREKATREKK